MSGNGSNGNGRATNILLGVVTLLLVPTLWLLVDGIKLISEYGVRLDGIDKRLDDLHGATGYGDRLTAIDKRLDVFQTYLDGKFQPPAGTYDRRTAQLSDQVVALKDQMQALIEALAKAGHLPPKP